ncbi:MAG: 12-dehydrotetracycline 5-monooxygenase/anhydrotetracycline 6-monooxygenase [Chlamydiales bacterium]|nr:12-dehydrotetracycline 5-monooxygenase/anhydrotetracycline 6-monooxygenase [Chlamydiales bacterium]
MDQQEVLIVGSGPTGLMLAAELARYGIQCRLIDKAGAPTKLSKALVIQPRTLEIFQHLGIVERFLDRGLKLHAANPMSQKKRLAHVKFDHLPTPYPFILSLEQSQTEHLLTEHLTSLGVQIEREQELLHFEQTESGVVATVHNLSTQKEEKIHTNWLVGCDGAHSCVRKQLNLTFEGEVFPDIFSLADIHLEWEYPHDELFFFLEPDGVLGIFPLPEKNRVRLIFQNRALLAKTPSNAGVIETDQIPPPTLEEVQAVVAKHMGSHAKVYDPQWLAHFHINSRMTKHYRKGTVFLAGDAAHIHSPVGGQGMNTGLQDAYNLAWKLAYVIQKKAAPTLLDTYELERQSVGKTLLEATKKATYAATLHNKAALYLRNTLANYLLPRIQNKLATAISQIGIKYPQSSLTKGEKSGKRAPDALINGGETTLYQLWQGSKKYRLVIFSAQKNALDECKKDYDVTVITDLTGPAKRAYGTNAVYLIRPDGYIAESYSSIANTPWQK